MFGFGKKKVYKVKWLEPRANRWFVKHTTQSESDAYAVANQLEAEGHRVRIFEDDGKDAVYTSKSVRPLF